MDLRIFDGTGSHSNSIEDTLIVNLKVWSENFAILALIRTGAIKTDVAPATRKNGNASKPNKIPNLHRTGPVMKNCIIMEAAPAIE